MTLHQFLMIVVMCLVIFLLRAFPFIVFRDVTKKVPPLLLYLGHVLTAAAISMLVVYGLASLCSFQNPDFSRLLWAIPSTAATVALQYFTKNSLVSIIGGTGVYMLLLQCLG